MPDQGASANGMMLVSSSDVGAINRGRILQALYDNGPTSRADLARKAGVNRTTVTGIVQPMIAESLLVEGRATRSPAQGGKPARPLFFNPGAPMLVAVLLLPGRIQTCLVTLTGEISALQRASFDVDGKVEAFTATMIQTLAKTLAETTQPPFGIGIAAGGMIDSDNGIIITVSLAPVLTGLPLVNILSAHFGLPVVIDHHPRALLVGDRWFGPGRGQQNFAAIYTGEVLGGAFYINGQVYRGLAGSGGELGHTIVQFDGLFCNCGKRGCWETIAALSWLRDEAARMKMDNPQEITSARLVSEAETGAVPVRELLDRYARNIAVGIANLQQTMSLNFYILHGDAATGGLHLCDLIKQHVQDLVPKRPNQEITIVSNGVGEGFTALRGAAGLVVSEHLKLII
ncbi:MULTISPECIES: ROK family transcriptional regulator [unclassified Rhizobium]|uniref:ROK family transcriptional regulator n=1 Tax=unclassified Rhizobium TaxID=2613769 RepID=UPI001ADD2959|nr:MULTISPECIES: ROK family transcriptional regulator [unclassified Rhizobium]MBO9102138.1 ROK family transcriptional regulator [Rhizobium sp. L58/93]MBO9136912.1 ROK family transcriptional regulator [Rhizobium sp. B209b/85]MBO9172338.1 ROK family transcriptional regulator [Rhizobium sp. L245/93]MBO9186500.1 ROK family transcriptional regulator [Rhizobium sp. E27B/91]QXZ87452.1 ROK family transcriptional regulator [Rhizobium sp. K1/93]